MFDSDWLKELLESGSQRLHRSRRGIWTNQKYRIFKVMKAVKAVKAL